MKRGTTPTIPLEVDKDVSDGWTLYATFRSGMHNVTLENDRMDIELEPATETEQAKTLITVTLTQEETLALGVGNAEVQIRGIKDGTAFATDIQHVEVGRILKDGVIDELPQS